MKCPVGLTQAQHNCGAAKGKLAATIPSVTNQQSNVVVMGVKNPWVKHFLEKKLNYRHHCGWPLLMTNCHSDNKQSKGLQPAIFMVFCGLQVCNNEFARLHENMFCTLKWVLFLMASSISSSKAMKIKIINVRKEQE